jgi:phage tail-like protein
VSETLAPIGVFNFEVKITKPSQGGSDSGASGAVLCSAAFSECTGLEASLEPREIREGGRNYGVAQRAGRVTFQTVVLKRGITANRDLFKWFDLFSRQEKFSKRVDATITLRGQPVPESALSPRPPGDVGSWKRVLWTWKLARCMPVKFKVPDLDATSTEVGIEELHLAHEGMTLESPEDERGSGGRA